MTEARMAAKQVGDDVEQILEDINDLIEDDELDEALELVEAAVEKHPDSRELKASLAEVAVELEQYERALDVLEAALDGAESDERGSLLTLKGYAKFHLGKSGRSPQEVENARHVFNEAIRLDPENWSAMVGRASVHEQMGFFNASMLDVEHAIELDDQEAEPFAIRARIGLRRGQLEDALRDFRYALESDPADDDSRLQLARLLTLSGNAIDAIETVGPLIDQDGCEPHLLMPAALLRSQLSLTMGSTAAATEDAQRAIDVMPEQPWGHLQLATCYLSAMNAGEAIKILKHVESLVPDLRDVPDIFALRAAAYDQLEKKEKAQHERAKAEGTSRLPAVVYGPILNPARNVPINPDRPIDVRAVLADLFGAASRAPKGYEDALREVIDRIPEIIAQNPDVERIQIELPEVEGMIGGARNLVIQVNRPKNAPANQPQA
jgi:tetratricopeptide (TPR) repeat protein